MTKIATDDAFLFGSLGVFAIGIAFVVGSLTGNAQLALGAALVALGLPSAVIVFLAATAGES